MDPILSIVIVNWNSGDLLRQNLASLARHNDLHQVEVIVVDNHSSDDSLESVGEQPFVTLVTLGENRGFAGGANAGVRQANAPLVLLLNPDITHSPGNLNSLVAGFSQAARRTQVGAFTGEVGHYHAGRRFAAVLLGRFGRASFLTTVDGDGGIETGKGPVSLTAGQEQRQANRDCLSRTELLKYL